MSRPHFRTHPGASAAFDRALHGDPRSITTAVSRATAFGVLVNESDLPLLITRRVEELRAAGDVAGANALKNSNVEAYQDENRALALLRIRTVSGMPSPDAHADRARAEQEGRRLEERARFADVRGAELFDSWLAERKVDCRERALAEYDRVHPAAVHTYAAPVAAHTARKRKTA